VFSKGCGCFSCALTDPGGRLAEQHFHYDVNNIKIWKTVYYILNIKAAVYIGPYTTIGLLKFAQ
jgi:hypothetical protein